MHRQVDLHLFPATEKVTLELHLDSDEDVMVIGEKVTQWHAPVIKAEPVDEDEIPTAPPGSKWDDSEAESIATVSSINYSQAKVTNAIQRLAKLLLMVGNAYRNTADVLPAMSTIQHHNIFQNLPLVNPVPTLPETAVNLFEEVGEKTFCTALAVGDHKSQKAAVEYYGVSASAVQ